MALTLLEKLDASCNKISLRDSVAAQVQRILSTRIYPKEGGGSASYVTNFGVPEVLSRYAGDSSGQAQYRETIRQQILALEPRLVDVEVTSMHVESCVGRCQLMLKLADMSFREQFYF